MIHRCKFIIYVNVEPQLCLCAAGGEDEDAVALVAGQQQDGDLPEPVLHPGVRTGPLPCCQHAPPRAVGDLLHPLEPTNPTSGKNCSGGRMFDLKIPSGFS